jgi:tetratricopeptide (TPR) repeat protein
MATKKTSLSTPTAEQDPSLLSYESALKLMHDRKFDRAKVAFEDLLPNAPQHIADRIRVHLTACRARLNDSQPVPKSAEEQYDYAVILMNKGRLDDARAHLEKLVKGWPEADFAYYGLAVLSCQSNKSEDALRNLQRAIELNPRNRLQARNDTDFQNMADDPRFTELLYPETLGDTASAEWRS